MTPRDRRSWSWSWSWGGALATGQLAAGCLLPAAAAAALWAAATSMGLPGSMALGLGAGAALAVGLVLALQVQHGLAAAAAALERLRQGAPAARARFGGSWPFGALLEQIEELGSGEGRLGPVRAQLLRQAAAAAAQEERNRLARDLHDSIKQQLFAVSVSAATAQARWDHDTEGARAALAEVRRGAQEAMVEMRAMLQQLRPAPLETVGLLEALREQCQALGYRTGAHVETALGPLPEEERLPVGAQESLFRIAQEAFANIARHARAGHVHVKLTTFELGGRESVLLEIGDDGQGFDVRTPTVGMGLSNISERVRALRGSLEVRSAPGAGTTIRAGVPLEEPGAARTARRSRRTGLLLAVLAVAVAAGAPAATTGNPELAVVPAGWLVVSALAWGAAVWRSRSATRPRSGR